jgi:hypothetical protein
LTSLVVSTSAARSQSALCDGWSHWTRLRHTDLGGLTKTDVRIMLYAPRTMVFSECDPSAVLPTCVYSVAGNTVEAGRPSVGPLIWVLHPLRVLPLGKNLYHGSGLYPRCPRGVRPIFLLPSVFHRPATWCLWALTPLESWMVWDVSYRICVLGLADSERNTLLGRLHPGRCLHEGLLRGLGLMGDEGVLSF